MSYVNSLYIKRLRLKLTPFVTDTLMVQLVQGSGKQDRPLLCLFSQYRGDFRSLTISEFLSEEERIPRTTWRRAIFLTADGQRYLTDLFREGEPPRNLWVVNSGKVIASEIENDISGETAIHRIRLSEITLRLLPE